MVVQPYTAIEEDLAAWIGERGTVVGSSAGGRTRVVLDNREKMLGFNEHSFSSVALRPLHAGSGA